MLDWQTLVRLPDKALARLDIAAMNLACAQGLPGSDRIDWEFCLKTLDDWARRCAGFTKRVIPYFHQGRCDFPHSEPRFRIQAMITHLQRDIGVRYHPGRKAETDVFQPEDSFVYGVIQGEGGTCGNLPTIYTAVGRRLGYPMMLATTRTHGFCRWDLLPRGDCFNIEASGEGVSFFPDEHYRSGRFEMSPETVAACGYLESLSPRQEVAKFMGQRASCWMREKNYGEAAISFAWATELDPRRQQFYLYLTWQSIKKWKETVQSRLPSRLFPNLDLGLPAQQFRSLSRELEREMIGLRVLEGLLCNPVYERRWWEPLRRCPTVRPVGMPDILSVDFRWNRPGHEAILTVK
ncbi:hypothetical protein [Fimbriiglobus ruber]|uniref:hypothetical protein n=1 Tax=Fimbriiglobus ruber TaxID=1908690 RepID=UPI000B4AE946|nr:hypothetical protein [Fimbriiglobus ruber]